MKAAGSGDEPVAIPGLRYIPGFVDEPWEAELLAAIDAQPWLGDLKRRVQHYGYRYDYQARTVDPSMYLGPLPDWALPLVARLTDGNVMPSAPNQLIVNEYEPGQGISPHVDCIPCFGPVICSVTLGSSCVMVMRLPAGADERRESLLLERGSLLVLAGPARYDWRHSIPARKSDRIGDQVIPRGRRVSLTFRTVAP